MEGTIFSSILGEAREVLSFAGEANNLLGFAKGPDSNVQQPLQNTYVEAKQAKPNTDKSFNWTPWAIGGGLVTAAGLLITLIWTRK